MAKVRCPKITCRSTDCTPITEKKKYSVGKGIVGGAIGTLAAGPVFGIVGAASGLNGKKTVKMMCNKCGNIFTIKV